MPSRVPPGLPLHSSLHALAMHAGIEFEGTRPDGWDPACACYSVVISPADDGASSPDPDELACAEQGSGLSLLHVLHKPERGLPRAFDLRLAAPPWHDLAGCSRAMQVRRHWLCGLHTYAVQICQLPSYLPPHPVVAAVPRPRRTTARGCGCQGLLAALPAIAAALGFVFCAPQDAAKRWLHQDA